MKRTVILLLLAFAGTLAAQQVVCNKGMESKHKVINVELMKDAQYLGVHNNLNCWITEGKKHTKVLVMTDHDLMVKKMVAMAESGDREVLAAVMNEKHVSVLALDRESRKQTVVYRYTLWLDSISNGIADTVQVIDHGKKDKCTVWGASSPSGSHTALVTVVEYADKREYSTHITMMDDDLDREWEKEYALKTMQNIQVTDDGRIVTFGIEREPEETHFVFNVIDKDRADSFLAAAKCDPIKEMNLVTVNGNHAIAAGTFFSTTGKHRTGGVLAMSVNLDSASISGLTIRAFSNEDINIFLNKDTKKTQRDYTIDRVRTLSTTGTDYGAVMLVGRSFKAETVQSNGAPKSVYFASGMHCVAIDTLGNVKWVRNLRRSDMQKNEGYMMDVSVHGDGEDVRIVKMENPKMPKTYDIGPAAKTCKLGEKANMVLYSIKADGEVKKIVVEPKTKQSIYRTLSRADGSLLILSDKGGKMRQAVLKITE